MGKTKVFYKSSGRSMVPLINPGDLIFIKRIRKDSIKIGDIVLFLEKKKCLSHRIIGFSKNGIVLKGDNVNEPDRVLNSKEILGKVVKIKGGYGEIDLESRLSRFFSLYFIFRSRVIYFTKGKMQRLLARVLRGRKIIVKNILAR